MCGRFFLSRSAAEVAVHFQLADEPVLAPRYNIAPGQRVPLIRATPEGRVLGDAEWSWRPRWAPAKGPRPINARSETAADKPLFRDAFARRRALIPADGFYEWLHRGRSRRPFAIRIRDGELFGMAALWEPVSEPSAGEAPSCVILTTASNRPVGAIHDRMPVILRREAYADWLDPGAKRAALQALLEPCPDAWMTVYPVDSRVNDARRDEASLIEPERDLFS